MNFVHPIFFKKLSFNIPQLTVSVSVKEINRKTQYHPNQEPYPADTGDFCHQISTGQHTHNGDKGIISQKGESRNKDGKSNKSQKQYPFKWRIRSIGTVNYPNGTVAEYVNKCKNQQWNDKFPIEIRQ